MVTPMKPNPLAMARVQHPLVRKYGRRGGQPASLRPGQRVALRYAPETTGTITGWHHGPRAEFRVSWDSWPKPRRKSWQSIVNGERPGTRETRVRTWYPLSAAANFIEPGTAVEHHGEAA